MRPLQAWAVIPAGGSGSRFSSTQDKLLADLNGKPVLVRTLQAFLDSVSISGIILVASPQNLPTYQDLVSKHFNNAPIHFTTGGASRRESVYNGLLALPESAEIAAIHDAARPLIQPALINQAIEAVRSGQTGAIIALPITDTVKLAAPDHCSIRQTIDRSNLWRAQTPQAFQKTALLQAHRQVPAETPVTDDAQLMELAGLGPVALIPGSTDNLKITTSQDIHLAEALLSMQPSTV